MKTLLALTIILSGVLFTTNSYALDAGKGVNFSQFGENGHYLPCGKWVPETVKACLTCNVKSPTVTAKNNTEKDKGSLSHQ